MVYQHLILTNVITSEDNTLRWKNYLNSVQPFSITKQGYQMVIEQIHIESI